jgi:hypothetical protein
MRRWFCIALLALASATTGHAQLERRLPANGKLGEVGERQPFPMVQINKKLLRLAPGGLIFDTFNRTILHLNLPEQATVLYVDDRNGEVSHIYVLRPEELERVKKSN